MAIVAFLWFATINTGQYLCVMGTMSTKKDPLQRLHQEMKGRLKEAKQHKTKIEELTKSTIKKLRRLQDLSIKAHSLQSKNEKTKAASPRNNHKFEMDYELTNLKMIKKILALSTPFEAELCASKKKRKPRKKRTDPRKKENLRPKGQNTNGVTKVLIVEDDPITIKIITHILEQHDFEVGFATDAEDGFKRAFKEMPNLILLDIMLPGMDGLQLLTKLQATEKTSQIPVVILSSLSAEKDILKGLEKGATDYILKPFSPQILYSKIKKILSLSLKNEHPAYNRNV